VQIVVPGDASWNRLCSPSAQPDDDDDDDNESLGTMPIQQCVGGIDGRGKDTLIYYREDARKVNAY